MNGINILNLKHIKLLLLIITPLLFITGCGGDKHQNEEEKPKVEENVPKEPEKKVTVIDLESNSRPYAVMINNNSAVWKYQSGLNDAYIVYEMLVEGGITRELALFKDSEVEKIQSIRSSRHYFLDYVLENDAIYVHWGWSDQARSDISSLKINNINGLTYEGKYFFRDSTVKAAYEHKGYTKMSSLKTATEKLGYRSTTDTKPLLNYSADSIDMGSIEGAVDAKYVEAKFSGVHNSKWTYDEETKLYYKKQNNTEMVDFTSKEKFSAKNIIIYKVGYSNIKGDAYGRLNMSNTGSGEGYYISEGKAIPITWEKSSRSSKTIYKLKNGEELKVNDGNTYIELLPTTKDALISASIPE